MWTLLCLVAAAAAAPATYNQQQEGEFNVRADVQNVVLLLAYPQKNMFGGFFKSGGKHEHDIQERADVSVMEAFVEPSTPYHVEIGDPNTYEGAGRAAEVVIAGRRRQDAAPAQEDEFKLVGAEEQCGPGGARDPATLECRVRADAPPAPPPTPAPQPAPALQPLRVGEQPVPVVVQVS